MIFFNKLYKNKIIRNTFFQLFFLYFSLILIISLGYLNKYNYHFEFFALTIGILSIFINFKGKNQLNLPKWLIIIPILILVSTRIMPYINNTVPLGYDPGIYKAGLEEYQNAMPNLIKDESWVTSAIPVGLPMITNQFYILGYKSETIITFILIFFEIVNLLMIYCISKEFFNKDIALLNSFFFSISTIQLLSFWYNYYKNIVAISIILLTIYIIKKNKYVLSIFTGGFLGGLHRPTFLVYGISLFCTWLRTLKWRLLLCGIFTLLLSFGFYFENLFANFLNYGEIIISSFGKDMGGTFVTFLVFQFSILIYLVLGLIGVLNYKKIDFLSIWFWFNLIIVILQLFFFKRFLIHLNIIFIIFSGYGFYLISKKINIKVVYTLLLIIIFCSTLLAYEKSSELRPLIDSDELNAIKWISSQNGEYVICLHKYYSPWVIGWSQHKTIAPGLFDYNKWNLDEWNIFWNGNSTTVYFMINESYSQNVYIFQGKLKVNPSAFEDEKYFEKIYKEDGIEIYKLK